MTRKFQTGWLFLREVETAIRFDTVYIWFCEFLAQLTPFWACGFFPLTDFTWTSGKLENCRNPSLSIFMGSQHPGDPRRQEGPLSSSDLEMKYEPNTPFVRQGTLTVHLHAEPVFPGDMLWHWRQEQAHLHKELSFLPRMIPRAAHGFGGCFYHILVTCSPHGPRLQHKPEQPLIS